jgi:hypothetical protein
MRRFGEYEESMPSSRRDERPSRLLGDLLLLPARRQ